MLTKSSLDLCIQIRKLVVWKRRVESFTSEIRVYIDFHLLHNVIKNQVAENNVDPFMCHENTNKLINFGFVTVSK